MTKHTIFRSMRALNSAALAESLRCVAGAAIALAVLSLGTTAHAGRALHCYDCNPVVPGGSVGIPNLSLVSPLNVETNAAPKRRLSLAKGAKLQRQRTEASLTAPPATNVTLAKP